MRVSKKALRPFAVILVSLSMSALLTGCQTSSDSASQAVGGSDAESTIQQQTTDASNSETNEQNGSNETVASLPQVFVTDVEGNRRNLSDFPWAQKYPTLLDGIASDTLTDYAFYTIASENLKARGESLTCDYFGDQQVTISVAGAEKGEAAAQIPQDKLQEGIDTFGEKNENYEYLTVTVNLTNSGSAEAEVYLNNLSIQCCVDGSIATETTCSEAVTSDLPAVAFGEKNQFQLMLAPGETRTCTVLYYVRAEIELSDLYLRANLGGNAMTEVKTADNVMNEEWLALSCLVAVSFTEFPSPFLCYAMLIRCRAMSPAGFDERAGLLFYLIFAGIVCFIGMFLFLQLDLFPGLQRRPQ